MHLRLLAVLLLPLTPSISACASGTVLTQTGPAYPPRDPRCEFLAFAAQPSTGFVQIGTVDIDPKSWAPFERLDDFKAEIRPYVCKAGGDAVIAYVNGHGWYIKAIVLKQVTAPTAPAAASAPPAPPPPVAQPTPPPAAPSGTGCQYDTQCKGDRICENGACVAPAPPAAPSSAPVTN
jgi:hypothetical protein